jgi:nitroimidazol reductase NimA-like FMN-containing flavoprotein (pyridoxamine 5'-phosphate oxidase superfamily)
LSWIKEGRAGFNYLAAPIFRCGAIFMDETLRNKILELLDRHRIMTVATNRPDGWPQATTVGYVNDGLTLYFLCGAASQKAQNLARDTRISLTIDHDSSDPTAITGLSMAAHAATVDDPAEATKAWSMMPAKFTEYAALPMPKPEEIRIFRVTPTVISVLDYTKGFGHSDLVTV